MADIWYDVDTALSEVPVNILPLLDDTDFKSIEGAVAYNAAGMALRWHFVTTAGAYTVTSVTPTSGGAYDWTDQGDSGIYTIEIPASGGASINNDTEGFGWFTGVATGVLPWRGPVCGFRAAALNDALIDSTTGLLGSAQIDFNCLTGSETAIEFTTGSYSTVANEFSSRFLIHVPSGEMRTVTASSDTAGTTTLTVATFTAVTTGDAFILVGSSVASR